MSDSARKENLKANLRREIQSDSRLLAHTKSSGSKFSAERSIVVSTGSGHLKEVADASGASRPSNSPYRPDAYYRHFHSQAAMACIRQESPRPALSPQRSRSFHAGVVPPPQTAATKPEPVKHAGEVERAGLVKRSGPFPHHKNIVFPTEDPNCDRTHRKLWLNKPLANGQRHALSKKILTPRSAGADDEEGAPQRRAVSPVGKRRLTVQDHIVGCGAEVLSSEKPSVPHRAHEYHRQQAPYFEPALDKPEPEAAKQAGLLGFGPTGKKHIQQASTMRLVDHKSTGWRKNEENDAVKPTGPRMIPGKSYESINLTDPTLMKPSKEESFKPSIVVMQGAPPFTPQGLPPRGSSPGRRFIDPGHHDIVGGGISPRKSGSVGGAGTGTPERKGRGVGTYSPNRASDTNRFY